MPTKEKNKIYQLLDTLEFYKKLKVALCNLFFIKPNYDPVIVYNKITIDKGGLLWKFY